MPWPAPKRARVTNHPGSSEQDLKDEPDYTSSRSHRIGYRNREGTHLAGLTDNGDHDERDEEEREFVEKAMKQYRDLRQREKRGDLINFQQLMDAQTDFHKRREHVYPVGWRFMIGSTEDEIKYKQDWPANIERRKKEEQKVKEEEGKTNEEHDQQDSEHDWRRANGHEENKHFNAYGKSGDSDSDKETTVEEQNGQNEKSSKSKSEYQKLREKYTPEEITLLRHLQHEAEHVRSLQNNDGKQDSPMKSQSLQRDIAIDTQDGQTPDNWIPRSGNLMRRTGQHPMNGEPRPDMLFDAGIITPNELHYVRNHGAVPRLYWDTHTVEVNGVKFSMDDLADQFEAINIPIALACVGNRRGEMNLIKKSKGYDFGPSVVGNSYWKGALLHDVLVAAGVERKHLNQGRRWVNFEGADEPSEGKYQTSIPLDYAMDRCNDVLLAYEMNNVKLPADHGFPLRLMIPGFVGGRAIKWLSRIWISEKENDSYYHNWDNRILPSFISEKDGDFAYTMFHHPSTAAMEQNLNSVIVKPSQAEKHDIVEILNKDTFRVEGFAYDGGGHEVQRVELSLDGGETWLYCIRKFPDRPIRNGNRFWTWLYWHIDIDSTHLARAESLRVRCFNVFKNTQPEKPVWNLLGMLNNGHYVVKSTTDKDGKLVFLHPFGQDNEAGWMVPSTENQLKAAKQSSGTPDKQFTRQEIEKHTSKNDCWLVINDNVYDVTSVLSWHPGGSAAILANSGKMSLEVTSQFQSVHDDYAHKKLQECAIGRVTDKGSKYMREQAKAEAQDAAKSGADKTFLQSKKWLPVKLKEKKKLSEDTFTYVFEYDTKGGKRKLGMGACQHIQFGFHMEDKMLIRSYTPTRPISVQDDDGTFDLTVKTYFPDENQPGGAFSNIIYSLPIGEQVEVNGPTGEIRYIGAGKFEIEGQEKTFRKVNLVLGGSGLTPGYSLLQAITEEKQDDKSKNIEVRVVDANKTEDDILLHSDLDRIESESKGSIKITHVLSHPKNKDDWKGLSGHVNADIIRDKLFEPTEDTVVFLCGPPGMIQKAAQPALKDWGFKDDENMFGF